MSKTCADCMHCIMCKWIDEMVGDNTCDWFKEYEKRPTGEFTIDELEKWLYQIAFNNTDNDFGKYCEEIIGRLNGFKRFVADARR